MQLFRKKETEAEEVSRICREVLHPETIPVKVPMNRNLVWTLRITAIVCGLIFFSIFHVQIIHFIQVAFQVICLAFKIIWLIVKWFWLIVLIDIVRALYHKLTRPRRRR